MGEKEPTPGKPSKEQRTESGLETAAEGTVGSGSEEQRLSTNMTIERQTPKRDFGD